ncbi:hypothetical protein [Nostoc sp. CHAB 5715]|uniref:hypothetical protein n=1 Tax=Nostoc sp. CHAB 5715 TaxID=2780400 RepID=UPI001E3C2EAB|nr:hypothetical protein [Nostoc sp. CHAB 5715]MCC5624831.1 hypothetical protein [Nostoc sp. CHAB 5715]
MQDFSYFLQSIRLATPLLTSHYVCDWKSSHHSSGRENIRYKASNLIRCKMKKLGDRYNQLDTKAVRSPDNEERLSRFSENSQ